VETWRSLTAFARLTKSFLKTNRDMNSKKFTTVEQIDGRFAWLDAQITICDQKAADRDETGREMFKSRANNLRHEKSVLQKRRQFLLTPEMFKI
jgi:hypothetical protein